MQVKKSAAATIVCFAANQGRFLSFRINSSISMQNHLMIVFDFNLFVFCPGATEVKWNDYYHAMCNNQF